ncbi:ABC transporter permease [Enterovirga aerilata]|uniref:ABC transporter permease n=1 Tax=Enterovirga aerilata TaxID=2730920 RepID=A0A849I2I2_9HYPH|nr:ABC transporter permease [Enterovirga sp. DB1703]NNM74026.1 ABC transporter permease [Enterovirga sp. DB1703]
MQLSFQEPAAGSIGGGTFTAANYARIRDPYYLRIIVETLKLAVAATAIGTFLAYSLAYFIACASEQLKGALLCLVMVPLMTSVVVKVFAWFVLLGRGGPVATLLDGFGFGRAGLLGTEASVLFGLVDFSLPFMVVTLVAAIERIPVSMEEAAANLGAPPRMIFARIIVPMIRSGVLLCLGISSSAYVVPATLGGRSVRMVAQQIYDDVLVAFAWPQAAATSVLVVAALGVVVAIMLLADRRQET